MDRFLSYITPIFTLFGLVISVYQYTDSKKKEQKKLNYQFFSQILNDLAGKILDDGSIKIENGFIIASIYKLLEFKEYRHISLPRLIYMKECPIKTDSQSLIYINKALDEVIQKLS